MSTELLEDIRTEPPQGPPRPRFRKDIQGLRAVAILLVVLYHAAVPGFGGGYVGVDVFFVISGYLITSQLIAEVVTSGRLSLTYFYLRRVRRLLPSALLVILSTLAVARLFAPALLTIHLSVNGIFATFYAINYRLAVQGIQYQNTGAAPSAFQHFWSLAVEEQFYIVWPLLIILALTLSRKWWLSLLPVLLIVVICVSFYISQYLLSTNAPMSFFHCNREPGSLASAPWSRSARKISLISERGCRRGCPGSG